MIWVITVLHGLEIYGNVYHVVTNKAKYLYQFFRREEEEEEGSEKVAVNNGILGSDESVGKQEDQNTVESTPEVEEVPNENSTAVVDLSATVTPSNKRLREGETFFYFIFFLYTLALIVLNFWTEKCYSDHHNCGVRWIS